MTDQREHVGEYVCVECGRTLIRFPPFGPGAIRMCGACIALPGWFRDPDLRRYIDRDHNGREERQET